jgi:aspartate-semialdehyde dehydrogenase
VIKVGVLGATGMVGQRFIQILDKHPNFEISSLTASSKSAGKRYEDATTWYLDDFMPESVKNIIVSETDPNAIDKDVEILFSSLPTEHAKIVEPKFGEKFIVASNASAMRMVKDVPLIIPEVNPEFLDLIEIQQKNRGWDGFIVTNPNCSTIALALTLKPIYDNYNIKKVYVSTMQAVSGAGYNGVPSMAIVDNLIPFIDSEEEKMESETLHILGTLEENNVKDANFNLSASCNRVAVIDGHTENVFIELDDNVDILDIKSKMSGFRGLPQKLNLFSAPKNPIIVRNENNRPQPRTDRNAGKGMSISIGRLRKDLSFNNSFKYTLVGHNTIRGGAGASILNAELIVKKLL